MDGRNIEVRRSRPLMDFCAHEVFVDFVAGGSDFDYQSVKCSLRLFLVGDFYRLLLLSSYVLSCSVCGESWLISILFVSQNIVVQWTDF